MDVIKSKILLALIIGIKIKRKYGEIYHMTHSIPY